jgi:hypothetical protein
VKESSTKVNGEIKSAKIHVNGNVANAHRGASDDNRTERTPPIAPPSPFYYSIPEQEDYQRPQFAEPEVGATPPKDLPLDLDEPDGPSQNMTTNDY